MPTLPSGPKMPTFSPIYHFTELGTKKSFMRLRRLHFPAYLFLLFCLTFNVVKATHLMGTDITYTCINNCTIQIDQRVYRDCAGSQGVQQQNFEITGAPGCILPTQIGGWLPGNNPGQVTSWDVSEVTPVCPGTVTQCNDPNSSIRGVQEYHRWTTFDICNANCNSYTIEWWGLARNGGITSGAANEGLGSFLTTINTGLASCNNSPQFNNPPVPYLCAGQPFTFNQGAQDPDGDSLSYSLGQCFTDQNASITYNPGYSPTSPLGSSWQVVMNPISGDVSFVPQPGNIEVGVMCVYVQEWRNGQLINTIVRDMQINVIPCPNNQQPSAGNIFNIQNGQGQGNSTTGIVVGTCLNNSLCFDIPLVDANLGDTITAWWNQAIPGGTFSLQGNPNIQDTLVGVNPVATFCWTPTSAGVFSFLVEMRDNACPQYGFSQFTVTIVVSNPTALAVVQSVRCDTATICGFGFTGIQPYSYAWSGQGGISGTTACVSNIYPGPGPYNYSFQVTDSLGCVATFNGVVNIPAVPIADAGPDILACQLFSDTIGGPTTANNTYLWNPITGLSSGTISNPVLTIVNPGPTVQQFQYVVTQTSTATGCLDRDTMNITVSYPPQLTFVPDQIECYGTPTGGIDMTVTNGLAPFIYLWTGPNGFTANTEDLTNIYAGTYVVTVIDSAGCTTIDSLTISQPASPLWVALISTDICCNGALDGLVDATITGDSPPYIFGWTGPGAFSAATEDINGLGAGMYVVTVSDSIGCVITDSVEIHEPTPVLFNFNVYDAACNGDALGIVAAHITGGYGNYGLSWQPGGQTTDSITGLVAGDYVLTVSDTCFGDSLVNIYFEDFEGHSPWTLNQFTGPNGLDYNRWAINDGEGGNGAGLCGVTNNGDTTLHIVTLANPNGRAAYNAGGSCGTGACPQTNIRAESPFINTVGYTSLTLEFDFLSLGDALNDNCSVLINDGSGWTVLAPSIKSINCGPGIGRWQQNTILLPASASNIPNLQIGFNWTNNDDGVGANPSVAINNARIFAPRIFSPSACFISDTATVGEPGPITSSIVHTNVLCFGDSTGTATATAAGGNGNFHYAWSNGAVGALVGNLPAGQYVVTVTDTAYTPAGGLAGFLTCTHLDTVVITQPPLLVAIASATNTSCFLGSDGQVTVAVSGGVPNYSYQWNTTPLAFTQTVTGLPTNGYNVTVTDLNGCEAYSSTVVSQPSPVSVQMTMTNSTCGSPNGTATASPHGGTPGYTYQWGTTPVQTGSTATGLMAGIVLVTVTDVNGCQTTGQINVGNEPRPQLFLDFQSNLACFGDNNGTASVVATGGRPPYSYSWSNGQLGAGATGLSAGTVFAYVTDFFGCRDTLAVTILQPTPVAGTVVVQDMGCNSSIPDGTAGVLPTGGTPGYTYNWSSVPAQTGQMATGLAPGIYFVTVTDANGCTFVTSDTVRQIPRPNVNAGAQATFCEGEGGVIITASGSGTPGPYFYAWSCDTTNTFCGIDSIYDNDPLVNPDTSTWYYVFVTDQNGCRSDTDSVFVVVLPKPIVDAGGDHVICGDSAPCVILTPTITGAPGPFSYHWSPGTALNDSTIANPCARADTTTIYTLQVQAGNGCWSQLTTTDTLATVTVIVAPIPIAEAGPDRDICFGDTTQLQGYGTGAGPVYTFEWTPAQGLSDTTIAAPWAYPPLTTDFTLVVWSNGCPSYADTVNVDVHTIPTVEAGWDREICLGDTAIMDALAWGDSTATYSFQWSPGTGIVGPSGVEDANSSPDSTTTYYVVATTNWGCESAPDSMTVYLKPTPIADAGPNLTMCGADSIVLLGGYYYTTTDTAPNPSQVYFSWVPADSLNDSTMAQPTSWASNSTVYHLQVRYNTCVTEDSMILTVIPELIAVYEADTNVICDVDSIQLHASAGLGGAVFLWSPSAGLSNPNIPDPMASPDTTTTYHLLVEEGGCTVEGDITIEVIPNPDAEYLSSLPDGCPPHPVDFIQTAENGTNFIWNFGDGLPVSNSDHPSHTYDTPGTYVVTLIAVGIGGCADTAQSVTVTVYDTARVDFASDPTYPVELFLPNTNVDFQNLTLGGMNFTWNFGDGMVVNDLNPSHTYQQPGEYFVTLTATNELGCISHVTKGPYVVSTTDLFIPNVFSPNGDGINDVYMVNYTGSQPFTLQMTDRWGVKVYVGNNKTQGWDGKDSQGVDVPDGVYYYFVKIGGKEYTGPATLMR
jgi:gliding motility-associated-like protein